MDLNQAQILLNGGKEAEESSSERWSKRRTWPDIVSCEGLGGGVGQGVQVPLDAGEGNETHSPLELPEGRQPCRHPNASTVVPIVDVGPKRKLFPSFKPRISASFVTATVENEYTLYMPHHREKPLLWPPPGARGHPAPPFQCTAPICHVSLML